MNDTLLAVMVAVVVGAVGGALAPRVIAVLPEPSDPDDAKGKISYRRLAEVRGLAPALAVAAAVTCALLAWQVGWSAGLPIWLYVGVVGVALAYIDWRTRLLPTRVIAPSYAVVAVLALLASAFSGDWGALLTAFLGWLIAGGLFFVLWFIYPKGMGYGDVRLSGVLGIALGWLGWAELIVGVYSGFLLGALGGGLLVLLRIVDRKRYPFGPFMIVGALVGVLTGPPLAAWYLG
ncbi:MAG: A24 family peptidase [Actinomycetota bacterium]|nr:A24 family peptidase [Actinomycetota bacterium]